MEQEPVNRAKYACKCGKAYARQSTVYNHIRIKHGFAIKEYFTRVAVPGRPKGKMGKNYKPEDNVRRAERQIQSSREIGSAIDVVEVVDVVQAIVPKIEAKKEEHQEEPRQEEPQQEEPRQEGPQLPAEPVFMAAHNVITGDAKLFKMKTDPADFGFLFKVKRMYAHQEQPPKPSNVMDLVRQYFGELVIQNDINLTIHHDSVNKLYAFMNVWHLLFEPRVSLQNCLNLVAYFVSRLKGKQVSPNQELIRLAEAEFEYVMDTYTSSLFVD